MSFTSFRLSRHVRRIFLAFGIIVLCSCGFHLSGPRPLAFSTVYVGENEYTSLGIALRRQIALSGSTTVEKNASLAEVTLQILTNVRGREILSLTPAGTVREYELTQLIRFRLVDRDGSELIPPSTLSVRREFTFSDELILGKEQEEALLYNDMESDLIRQLMRRLAAWQRP
ncbi:MAG: LPS assembly lipoprotein LptE [Betaproteobacteria bacterium]|nr:LPS assembly lipoprotein LptE [Betaproteobacteria bacterium]